LIYHKIGEGGGRNAFTKRAHDWKIVWKKKYKSKSKAQLFEKYLKKQKGRKFIKQIITEGA